MVIIERLTCFIQFFIYIYTRTSGPPSEPMINDISNVSYTVAVVSWEEGFHGGYDQTIHFKVRSNNDAWVELTSVRVAKRESKYRRTTTLRDLLPGTTYYIRLFASNERGSSGMTDIWNLTTKGSLFNL